MNHEREQNWLAQARTLLDASAESLDAATLSRLNRARQQALAQRRAAPRWAFPAGMVSACMLLLALFVWNGRGAPGAESPLAHNAGAGDLELVSSEDSLEFYQDLEFYAWLEAQDQDLGS